MEVKSFYKRKYLDCKTLDIDTSKRQVKIAIAETETKDYDGDIILPTAAVKTIKERGPQGTNEIWHLLDHTGKSFSALSKFSEMGIDGKYIYGVSNYKDSFAWREVAWPLYESGDFTQHSIGFQTIDEKQMDGYNEIREIKLFEGSAVLWGANPNTPLLAISKAMGFDAKNEDIFSQINRIVKGVKMVNIEDDSHKELIVIELEQLKQDILNIQKNTEPAKPIQPFSEELKLIEILTTFKNSLKS